jgi:oxygen-independent coproporphyrinogen-3 oxidase
MYLQNHKKINDYEAAVAKSGLAAMRGVRLNRDDQIRRDLISRLMCHLSLDIPAFESQWGINLEDYFPTMASHLLPMQADGLVKLSATLLSVTPLGLPFIRNIVMGFDRYLETPTPPSPESNACSSEQVVAINPRPRFSQTI